MLLIALSVVAGLLTSRFKNLDKLSLVVNGKNGNVLVQNFDFANQEIVNITIPGETQLDVANQFGNYRAESVWKLGINEKKEGELLRLSIVKNFNLPVVSWADSRGEGFGSGGFLSLIKSVIIPYKSNLRFGDKLRLAFFSVGVREGKRTDINLEETGFLKETRLLDGENGFLIGTGKLPVSLAGIFSEVVGRPEPYRVMIKDNTGKMKVAEKTGEVLEVMGIKVASLVKGPTVDEDCVVSGKDKHLVQKVSLIFTCQTKAEYGDETFDLVLDLGSEFAKRY